MDVTASAGMKLACQANRHVLLIEPEGINSEGISALWES